MQVICFMITQLMMHLMKRPGKCTGSRQKKDCLTRALIPGGVIPQNLFPALTGAARVKREPWERFLMVGGEHKKYLDPAVANAFALEHAKGIYEIREKTVRICVY